MKTRSIWNCIAGQWPAILLFAVLTASLSNAAPAAGAPSTSSGVFAITGVTVLEGSGGSGREKVSVLVKDGRIEALVEQAQPLHPGIRRVDGGGGFLLPGFIDMHAHLLVPRCKPGVGGQPVFDRALSERMLGRLLDFGITTVRSPATPTVAGMSLRDDLNAGRVRGPRAMASAELINDPGLAGEPLRSHVRAQLEHRPDYLKLYAAMPADAVMLVVQEAHARGTQVIGHMGRTPWKRAVELGVDHLVHATDWSADWLPPASRAAYARAVKERGAMRARIDWLERLDPGSSEVQEILHAVRQAGVSIDPTLVAYDSKFSGPGAARYRRNGRLSAFPELRADWLACNPTRDWKEADFARWQAAWPKMLALVAQMDRQGLLLTTGSDLSNPWVIPGESLHQEFELLRKAGLSPLAILRMAGENGARALRRSDVGAIAPGRRADLVLLSADPRLDIRNTRKIVWTMKDGVVVSRGPGN